MFAQFHYTIGQRRGLGIAAAHPLYVTAIDPHRNTITVGPKSHVYSSALIASELNWIAQERLERPMHLQAKIRYAHEGASAIVSPLPDNLDNTVQVEFAEPQLAITPGQAIVFYDDAIVVGGGTIVRKIDAC